MTYPVNDPEAYQDWTPPPHTCEYIVDTTVEVGIFEDGATRVYEIWQCNQCPNNTYKRTDRIASSAK